MPDLVLDYHRLKTPIDHPDTSVTRTKLEYPTDGVALIYLVAINKAYGGKGLVDNSYTTMVTTDVFTDKAVNTFVGLYTDAPAIVVLRYNDARNSYYNAIVPVRSTSDHVILKVVAGTSTILATESVDLSPAPYRTRLSVSGSTLKSYRSNSFDDALPSTPQISATDTAFSSGMMGSTVLRKDPYPNLTSAFLSVLEAPTSYLASVQTIIELNIEGSGKLDDPFRPVLNKNLVEINSLQGLPDFLYLEAKKYQILRSKGFTDEEMRLIFGYIPQHQVDLDSISWEAFEFHPDKANTVIITITGDNPYQSGAIDRQKSKAKRVIKVPKDYNEAITLYNQLKKDYPHWLAGKDNFAYQIFGLEEFDWFQNIDFYYGEFIEHKTHYDQLKRVPDWEIRNRLLELREKISRMTILTDERNKHLRKIDEILRKGW